jgi:gamma-glutamylaminecyclotransferase
MACQVMMSAAVKSPLPAHVESRQPMLPMHLANPPCSLAFVYGTLKRGFSNHWLIEDVVGAGHAQFLGAVKTKQRYPLVCGPFQVPFLLNMPNSGLQVKGELYAVDQSALELLDDLEGVSKGHYQRRPLVLTELQGECCSEILAEAYFAFPTLQGGLSSAPHIDAYTKKETVDYVYRKDRPKNRTFLQHVEHWIEAQGPRSYICV